MIFSHAQTVLVRVGELFVASGRSTTLRTNQSTLLSICPQIVDAKFNKSIFFFEVSASVLPYNCTRSLKFILTKNVLYSIYHTIKQMTSLFLANPFKKSYAQENLFHDRIARLVHHRGLKYYNIYNIYDPWFIMHTR